jgi:L-ascorbate metabolism protein UlaG (beta-lactamase superfamily)
LKKIIDGKGYTIQVVEDGAKTAVKSMDIEAFGNEHALIYPGFNLGQNTGYFFNNKLFYPGDNLTSPGKTVDILALPVAGPWLKVGEAIDYALKIKPRLAVPVHDGNLKTPGGEYGIPPRFLKPAGIEFMPLEIGKEYDL